MNAKRIWILANNGQTVCDEHLRMYGCNAKAVDSRGGRGLLVTPTVAQQSIREFGIHPKCEMCGTKAALVIA